MIVGHGKDKVGVKHPQGRRLLEPDEHVSWAAVPVQLATLAVRLQRAGGVVGAGGGGGSPVP